MFYDYFVNSYIDGNTPNPCVKCNKNIKFGAMLDFAKEHEASFLSNWSLCKKDGGNFFYLADDLSKDQKLFLSQVLKTLLFFYDVSSK